MPHKEDVGVAEGTVPANERLARVQSATLTVIVPGCDFWAVHLHDYDWMLPVTQLSLFEAYCKQLMLISQHIRIAVNHLTVAVTEG